MVKEIIISDTVSWQGVFKVSLAKQIYNKYRGTIQISFDRFDNCIIDFYMNYAPVYRYTVPNISERILAGDSSKEIAEEAIKSVRISVLNKYFKNLGIDKNGKV